jgi:hypothetical protein
MDGIYSALGDDQQKAVAQALRKGLTGQRVEEFRKLFDFESLAPTTLEGAGAVSVGK